MLIPALGCDPAGVPEAGGSSRSWPIASDAPAVADDPCGPPGDVIYVDADAVGTGDGSSWANALTSPSLAMQAAGDGDELWIAEGTYRGLVANAPVLTLASCVDVYGGFVGTETALDERPSPLRLTQLHGDVANDDAASMHADNSLHVIVADTVDDVVLDGLVVTRGRATGAGDDAHGGGLLALDSSGLVLRDMTFQRNVAADRGGGIHVDDSTMAIEGGTFSGNHALEGGAIQLYSGATVTVTGSAFTSNSATTYGGAFMQHTGTTDSTLSHVSFTNNTAENGGAVMLWNGDMVISRGAFTMNSATDDGGALYILGENLTVEHSRFTANAAVNWGRAGRIQNNGPASVICVFDDVVFEGNTADYGGALYRAGGHCDVEHSRFVGNSSTSRGGAIYLNSGYTTVVDVLLAGNSSASSGGAAYVHGANGSFIDVRFDGNVAHEHGGGAYLTSYFDADFTRTTFSNNSAVTGDGGALRVTSLGDTTTDVHSSTFVGNDAAGDGGAIAIDNDATDYGAIGLDWQLLTTSTTGMLDAPPVDMGVHYQP